MSGRDQIFCLLVWFDGVDIHSKEFSEESEAEIEGKKLPQDWGWEIIIPRDLTRYNNVNPKT